MTRLFGRLLGVRFVESPEVVRITLPCWMVRAFPGVLDRTVEKLKADPPYGETWALEVRGRSVIARLRPRPIDLFAEGVSITDLEPLA